MKTSFKDKFLNWLDDNSLLLTILGFVILISSLVYLYNSNHLVTHRRLFHKIDNLELKIDSLNNKIDSLNTYIMK